ncbi:MAG: c-type cytochrome OmcS [Thermodesulfovibrionales bacterium]
MDGKSIALVVVLMAVVALLPLTASAKVTGICSNCHTMHNSQDGEPMAVSGGAWESGGFLNGTAQSEPKPKLLVADCIGCHSAANDQTIITTGGSNIPIVYNHVQPVDPLAGGNFYWVAGGDDTKGHNVYGISAQDSYISVDEGAPGHDGVFCAESCHVSLAYPPKAGILPGNWNRAGCQGCHVFTYHHEDNGVYRFLKGHGPSGLPINVEPRRNITTYTDYVKGVEDSDWEQTKSSTDHNWYLGTTNVYVNDGTNGLTTQHTVSSFCTGCHWGFHGPISTDPNGVYGMGSGSPWLRHPVEIALPTVGEYGGYDPINNYSTEAPVAWINTTAPGEGPVVMCLSCHRAHGSDQPDMLRWNYDDMMAGTTGAAAGTGCFTCHTKKDGVQ